MAPTPRSLAIVFVMKSLLSLYRNLVKAPWITKDAAIECRNKIRLCISVIKEWFSGGECYVLQIRNCVEQVAK